MLSSQYYCIPKTIYKVLGNIMHSMEIVNNTALYMRKLLRVSLKSSHHNKKNPVTMYGDRC